MWLYIGYCDRVSLPGLKLFFCGGEFWICFNWPACKNWEPFLLSLLALDLLHQNLKRA